MNRKEFFKRLVAGTAAVAVAPEIIAEAAKKAPGFLIYTNPFLPASPADGALVYDDAGIMKCFINGRWHKLIFEVKERNIDDSVKTISVRKEEV